MPNHEALAWAAGFFDGEGSVHVTYAWTRKDGTQGCTIQTALSQSGESAPNVLRRFQDALGGLGKIYGPYPPAKNQRLVRYQWEANGFAKTQAAMAMLWSWLSEPKKQKATEVFAKYHASRRV
jgi:hypothetical protein